MLKSVNRGNDRGDSFGQVVTKNDTLDSPTPPFTNTILRIIRFLFLIITVTYGIRRNSGTSLALFLNMPEPRVRRDSM